MTDYVTAFVQESEERITELNHALLELERDPTDDEAMESIFRVAHTLKSNSGAMGFESASDLAHAIEDLLDAVRKGGLEVTPELMDVVFDAVDELETMVDEVATEGEIETDPSATIEALREHLEVGSGQVSIEEPTDEEIDEVLKWFDPPADDDHEAYLARLSIAERVGDDGVNNGVLVVKALIDAFDLIGTEPPRREIEDGTYGGWFDAVFASAVDEAAIASGLEPVEEVDDFEIVNVSDRFGDDADAKPAATTEPTTAGSDITSAEAEQLEVDELLEEFDEYDDLDERIEEIDDDELEVFEEMGDAGSFDDLLEEEDLELDEPAVDSPASDDGADASTGATTEATQEEVDDASAVFDELKEEVEMVGFDELQDELEELEFEEFDSDEEVEMDELIGDDVDVEDDTFLEEATDDAIGDVLGEPADDAVTDPESPAWDAEDDETDEVVDADDAGLDEVVDAAEVADDGDEMAEGVSASDPPVDAEDETSSDPAVDGAADDDSAFERAVDADTDIAEATEVDESDVPTDDSDLEAGFDADPDGTSTRSESAPGDSLEDSFDDAAVASSTDETTDDSPTDDPFDGTADDSPTDDPFDETADEGFAPADDPFGETADEGFAPADDPFGDDTGFEQSDDDPFGDVSASSSDFEDDPFGDVAVGDDDFGGDADEFGQSWDTTSREPDLESADDAADDEPEDEYPDDVVKRVEEPTLEVPELTIPEASDRPDADQQTDEIQSVRVDVEQIDSLLTLVEGLVTNRVRLRHAVTEGEDSTAIEAELDDLGELTTDLQETVMDIRLVPLRTVTDRLPRVVRDIAREQDKEVVFETTGEDVELDRSILDRIGDPLIHLVRNAVDHGIEPPEERERVDKPPEGTVEIHADRSNDRVRITVTDDGSGLDPDRLRSEAVEAGVVSSEEAAALSDEETFELVFHPGLSTVDEVTDVSGRGVGMDVVKRTVEDLEGTVSIDSDVDLGTTVTMELPVTVAIDDVLFVECGGEEFGVPTKAVESIEPADRPGTDDGEPALGDESSVIRLDDALETARTGANGDGMIVRIREEVRPVALHCDEVHGQQEVVVKPFEGFMSDIPGLSGATVRGRGDVVNILDVTTL